MRGSDLDWSYTSGPGLRVPDGVKLHHDGLPLSDRTIPLIIAEPQTAAHIARSDGANPEGSFSTIVAITRTGPADARADGRPSCDVGPAAGGLAEHCGEPTLGLCPATVAARTVGGHRRAVSGCPGHGTQRVIHRVPRDQISLE